MDSLKENDMDFINEGRIMSFLRGNMTPEEEAKFKEDITHDSQLKADAVNLARLAKGMKQVGEERDLMLIKAFLASGKELLTKEEVNKEMFLEMASCELPKGDDSIRYRSAAEDKANNVKTKKVVSRKLSVWLSIAASLVVFVWLGIDYHSYRITTSLGDEYGNAISSGVLARGSVGESEAEKKLAVLFSNVRNGKNLNDAIHDLSVCWNLSNKEVYNEYTNYSAEIGWYLSIAYLKNNDKKNAKIVLEKLIASTEKDSVVNRKAKELMKKL